MWHSAHSLDAQQDEVRYLFVHGEYELIAAGPRTLKVWDSRTMGCLADLDGSGPAVMIGDQLVGVSAEIPEVIKIWESKTWKSTSTLQGHVGAVTAMAVHTVERSLTLFTTAADKNIRAWKHV